MVFCEGVVDADKLWLVAASATREGLLGWASKISFRERSRPALMCHTVDHENEGDRDRVCYALRTLLVDNGFGEPPLRYKTDEATEKGIFSAKDVGGRGTKGVMASQYHDTREVCKFFLQGRCKFGSDCRFLHPADGGEGGGGGGGDEGEDDGGDDYGEGGCY